MIKIDPAVLFIMGEVILALIVVMVGLIVFIWKSRKKERDSVSAADELRAHIKNSAPERQEWFQQLLTECIESSDPEANRELAAHWVERQDLFYTQLLAMYLKRDAAALRGFDKNVEANHGVYHELIALIRARIDESRETIPAAAAEQLEQLGAEKERLSAAVLTLEQENQRLNSEVLAATKEMDQAMREYSVAFRPGSGMTGSASPVAAVAGALPPEGDAAPAPVAPSPPNPEPAAAVASLTVEAEVSEPSTVLSDEWGEGFDELPDSDSGSDDEWPDTPASAAKGPVIDLADEGDIVLPQLNELMSAIDLEDGALDDIMGDVLSDHDLPVLDESIESDEAALLAQLEGLDDIGDMDVDSLVDAFSEGEPPGTTTPPQGVAKPPKV